MHPVQKVSLEPCGRSYKGVTSRENDQLITDRRLQKAVSLEAFFWNINLGPEWYFWKWGEFPS